MPPPRMLAAILPLIVDRVTFNVVAMVPVKRMPPPCDATELPEIVESEIPQLPATDEMATPAPLLFVMDVLLMEEPSASIVAVIVPPVPLLAFIVQPDTFNETVLPPLMALPLVVAVLLAKLEFVTVSD